MEELLFESKGSPRKRQRLMMALCVVVMVGGLVLIMGSLALPARARGKIAITGAAALLAGLLMFALGKYVFWDSEEDARLAVYSDHIEGAEVSPYREFSVSYQDIMRVEKLSSLSIEMLQIQTEKKVYTVLVNDPERAYDLINEKLDELEKI